MTAARSCRSSALRGIRRPKTARFSTPSKPEPPATASRLHPKYTFEQFVIGEGNRFAHAAALAVAELPAQAYNPLFLHGPPGLGKTHLLQAIGNYVGRYGAGLQVRYATIEEFTTAFVDAVRERRTGDFKERFRTADVVLIDDVQFLTGRTKTREEFFHTFNALLDSGRQLVISSDRSPDELSDLETRLAERFRSGLVVELEHPPVEVRRAILLKRAGLDGIEVSEDVLAEIAARVDSSVRALEGALIRVVAYASLKGEPATPELVRHVLRKLGNEDAGGAGLRPLGDPRCNGTGVRSRTRVAVGARPPARGRHGTPGRHVPRTRADQLTACPRSDAASAAETTAPSCTPSTAWVPPSVPTTLFAAQSTTCADNSAGPRDGRPHCHNQHPRFPIAKPNPRACGRIDSPNYSKVR